MAPLATSVAKKVFLIAVTVVGLLQQCEVNGANDTIPPELQGCLENMTEIIPLASLSTFILWAPPTATDNSGANPTVVVSPQGPGVYYAGFYTITYTATDGDNNSANCSFNLVVTPEDTEVPNITCPDNQTAYTDPGQSYSTFQLPAENSSSDNSGLVHTIIIYDVNGTTYSVGNNIIVDLAMSPHLVRYTASDINMNNASCDMYITVILDSEMPNIMCPDNQTVNTDSGQSYSTIQLPAENSSSDNSGLVPTIIIDVNGMTYSVGNNIFVDLAMSPHLVQYTASDASMNNASCDMYITVIDSEMPNITCPDNQTVNTDPGQSYSTFQLPAANSSSDNSGLVPTIIIDVNGTTYSVGNNIRFHLAMSPHSVQYTASDASMNNASCDMYITVIDQEKPLFASCPGSFPVVTDPQQNTANVTWPPLNPIDNVAVADVISSHQSGELLPIGTTVVTYNITDLSGNKGYCIFVVTVNDMEPPVITCPGPVISTHTDPQQATALMTFMATSADNSGNVSVLCNPPSGTNFTIPHVNVLCTATDPSDNINTCNFVILVNDLEDPVFDDCPTNIVLDEPLENFVNFTIVVNWTVVARDNVGVELVEVTKEPGTAFNIGSTHVVYTATDAAGNMATCEFNVIVNDVEPPVITGCSINEPPVPTGSGQNTARIVWVAPQASDNSGSVTLSPNHKPGDDFPLGNTTVTYTAIDPSGNTFSCSFVVQVVDDQPPEITGCPFQGVINNTLPGSNRGIAFWTEPQGSDNVAVVSQSSDYQPGASFPPGATVVTYNFTDAAGFVAKCSFNVIIQDVNECTHTAVFQECSVRGLTCFNSLGDYTCDCLVGFVRAANTDNCKQGRVFRLSFVIVEIFFQPVDFPPDLTNPSSVSYLNHQGRLQFLLGFVFNQMSGFGSVNILYFFSGSIGVQVTVTFDSTSTVTQEDVQNTFDQAVTSGDLLRNSEYKLAPSKNIVIEEVCVAGYCQNGGTCIPTPDTYLSSCTCPSGYSGDTCQNVTETPTDQPGLVIIAIIVGSTVALLLIFLLALCLCYAMRGAGRGRRDYLYEDNYEKPYRLQGSNTRTSMFRPRNIDGYRFSNGEFSLPYIASGREAGIPIYNLAYKSDADYY